MEQVYQVINKLDRQGSVKVVLLDNRLQLGRRSLGGTGEDPRKRKRCRSDYVLKTEYQRYKKEECYKRVDYASNKEEKKILDRPSTPSSGRYDCEPNHFRLVPSRLTPYFVS